MIRAMMPSHKEKVVAVFLLALFLLPGFSRPLFARDRKVEGAVTLYPGMGPIRESDAYKQFAMRPVTEYSKLLYLIDRFGTIDADILYDGMHYRTGWVAAFARGFLARSYRSEKAADWVMKWCNRGVLKGELIWAEFPNKKLQLGRLVLLDELKGLEAAIQDLPVKAQAVSGEAKTPPAPEKK